MKSIFQTRSGISNRKFECTIINRKCLLRGDAFSHEEMEEMQRVGCG